ncbi:MAG: hypothetical protein AAB348_02310 [Patescibacteria group bacterium]
MCELTEDEAYKLLERRVVVDDQEKVRVRVPIEKARILANAIEAAKLNDDCVSSEKDYDAVDKELRDTYKLRTRPQLPQP